LVVISLLIPLVLVTVLWVVGRRGGSEEEEGSLVGWEGEEGRTQPNGREGYFKSIFLEKKSSFCYIFCFKCKMVQE
jgi:hypothetical protein